MSEIYPSDVMDLNQRLKQAKLDRDKVQENIDSIEKEIEEQNKNKAKLCLKFGGGSHGMAGVHVTQQLLDGLKKYLGRDVGIGIGGSNYQFYNSDCVEIEKYYNHLETKIITC